MNFPRRGDSTQRVINLWKPPIARDAEAPRQRPPLPNKCPRCGKQLGRGKYMHLKTCKG